MFGLFKRRRSQVFQYDGPHGRLCFDPMDVKRKLTAENPEWPELVDLIVKSRRTLPPGLSLQLQKLMQARLETAITDLAKAATVAFDMPPLDTRGRGYSEAERMSAIAAFLAFCAKTMGDTLPLVVSPPATEPAACDSPPSSEPDSI